MNPVDTAQGRTRQGLPPEVRATVTNINTGGQWDVVQTITIRYGGFKDHAEADRFADRIVRDGR